MHSVVLAEVKDSLGHGVVGRRSSTPFLAEVRKSCHIVCEKGDRTAAEEMEEASDSQEHR